MIPNDTRLIEIAFPLEQVSLDSVHEKNVRHGHISTLQIWPARRPLAACRAALIAALLPDPGDARGNRSVRPWNPPTGHGVRRAQRTDLCTMRRFTTSVYPGHHGLAERLH